MTSKFKNTPLSPSGWNFRGILLPRRYKSGFSKLKEIYGNELLNAGQKKIASAPLTKEEKRKIKEKIKQQIQRQNTKDIAAFVIALVITVLFLVFVIRILSNYYGI